MSEPIPQYKVFVYCRNCGAKSFVMQAKGCPFTNNSVLVCGNCGCSGFLVNDSGWPQ